MNHRTALFCNVPENSIFVSMKKAVIIIESVLLAVAVGLGVWWYVHNNVVLDVEKVFEDGSSYRGQWLAGRMHGEGVHTLADGEVYEGSFAAGVRDGKGKVVRADGAEYDGFWKGGMYHGEGRYLSPKGNVYEGEWVFGDLPEGRLTNKDWTYVGAFEGLSPSGAGVTDYKDGRVYSGYWYKGYKQGLGRLTHPDGRVEFGYWDQGSLMRSGKKDFRTGGKVYGIDVSRHQGSWKWENVALYADKKGEVYTAAPLAGYEVQPPFFVLIKATEGSDIVDPKYAENVAQAREGRLVKGAYHFMTTRSDIETQIQNFISNALVEPGDFPPVLDIEISHKRMEELGVSVVQEMALKWLKAIEDEYGVRPVIYTNDLFRKKYLDRKEFRKYDYWMARYNKKGPDSGKWLLWQFTQTGRPRGISAETDINVFDGTWAEFKAWLEKVWKKS